MRLLLLVLLLAGIAAAGTLEEDVRERQFEQALQRIALALPKAGKAQRPRLLLLKADCEVQLQRLDSAERTLALLPVESAPPRFFRVRGQFNAAREEKDLARKDLRHVLELDPDPFETILAACELAQLEEDPEKATEWWNRAVEASQRPGMPDGAWGTLYRHRMNLLVKSGRVQEALSEARLARAHLSALGRTDGELGMLLTEALLLKNLGRFEEAEQAWTRAIERSDKASGGTLTVWGYNVLYGRTDPPALRRFLAACEKHWSESWSEYERFQLRLLEGQIYLYALNEPKQALKYLNLAEKLASSTLRPSGNFVKVSLRFHQLSTAPQTDLEQVVWLELRAVRRLRGDVVAFMESKLARLPASARGPWLFTLGEELLGKNPERTAQVFAQSLEGTTGADRARLCEGMLEAYLRAGRLVDARRAALAFGESLAGGVKLAEALEITRGLATHTQPWTQSLWLGSLEPNGESPQLAVLEGLLSYGGLRERFDALIRKEREEHLRTGDPVALSSDYNAQARQLALENKLAEAQVACERAREYAVQAQLLDRVAQADRLLAYLLFRLGERGAALERIRQARAEFAALSLFTRDDEVGECAALEAAFLLELHRPEEALELLRTQPQQPVLEYAQARALVELRRPQEAHALLDRCEAEVEGTLYAVGVKILRAVARRLDGQSEEALLELGRAYALARSLTSLRVRELVLLWHEWDPATAPVADAVAMLDATLARLPEAFAARVRERPSTQALLALAGRAAPQPPPRAGWLTRAEFLREAGALARKHPELATTVPLLPSALTQQDLGDEVLAEYYLGAREMVLFLAAREGFAIETRAVERAAVEERVVRVRRQLTGGKEDPAAAAELARVLLDPRWEGRPVVFVTHGPLLGLPWDLLPGPPLEWSLWAGEALAHYSAVAPRVLAVGNVTGVDLPGSAREVEAVARLLPGEVLTGAAATLDALRRGVGAADVVHLATHSTPAYLQLSDGKLALREIYGLPLRPGALVVLSSCEGAAAVGQERGPVTLASAFLAAGASQVVASLTPVADEEAEALFAEFYRSLARGLAPGAALREAKAARRKAGARADWAAFVLLGGS